MTGNRSSWSRTRPRSVGDRRAGTPPAGELPVLVAGAQRPGSLPTRQPAPRTRPTASFMADPPRGPDRLRHSAGTDDPSHVIVGSDITVQGRGPETDGPPETTCDGAGWSCTGRSSARSSTRRSRRPRSRRAGSGSRVASRRSARRRRLCDGVERRVRKRRRSCAASILPASAAATRGPRACSSVACGDDAIEALIFVPDLEEAP